jgi:hypothetical protein
MKKQLSTFFILFIINIISIYSQNYKNRFIAEYAELSINLKDFYTNQDNRESLSALSIYYSGQISLSTNYQLEFRPGYLATFKTGDKIFSKIQLGLFLRRNLIDSTFCAIGINSEINPVAEGNSNSQSPKGFTFSAGGTIGLKLDEFVSILLSYYRSLTELHGYSRSNSRTYYNCLYWFMKLGVELNL